MLKKAKKSTSEVASHTEADGKLLAKPSSESVVKAGLETGDAPASIVQNKTSKPTPPSEQKWAVATKRVTANSVVLSVTPGFKVLLAVCHAGGYQAIRGKTQGKAKTSTKDVRFDGLLPGTEYTFSVRDLSREKTITVRTLSEAESRKWRLYAITGFGLNSQSFDSRYEGLIATADLLESVKNYGESVAKNFDIAEYSGGYVIDVTTAGEDGTEFGCLGYAYMDGELGYVIDKRELLETRWKTDNDPRDPENFRWFLYLVPGGEIVWVVAFTDDEAPEGSEA